MNIQRSSHIKVIEKFNLQPLSTEDSEFRGWIQFECRNIEPVEFEARGDGFVGSSTLSDSKFEGITLDGEFTDYDEKVSSSFENN